MYSYEDMHIYYMSDYSDDYIYLYVEFEKKTLFQPKMYSFTTGFYYSTISFKNYDFRKIRRFIF